MADQQGHGAAAVWQHVLDRVEVLLPRAYAWVVAEARAMGEPDENLAELMTEMAHPLLGIAIEDVMIEDMVRLVETNFGDAAADCELRSACTLLEEMVSSSDAAVADVASTTVCEGLRLGWGPPVEMFRAYFGPATLQELWMAEEPPE